MITPIMVPLFSITQKTIRSCKKIATMNCAKYIKQRSTVYSVAGRGHTGKGIECEDITYLAETPKIRFFGLADGQSGKRCCREGGRAVLAAVFQFVASADITQLIQYKYVDELQYKIISVIRDTIDRLAASGRMDRAEYASTLVAFAYDIWTGQYMLIHLGDGGIIGTKNDGEIQMLSSPENGLTASYTWLTTSHNALFHLRIGFGRVQTYRRIMLITDGATLFAHGRNIPENAKKLISDGGGREIISELTGSNPVDDASCIVVDFL